MELRPAIMTPGRSVRLLSIAAVALCTGCPQPPQLRSLAQLRPEELSQDPKELMTLAETLEAQGDAPSLEDALVVRDKALGLTGSPMVAWQAARTAYLLADGAVGEAARRRRAKFAKLGVDYSLRAIAGDGQRVEGFYFHAINLGLLASTRTLGAVEILPEMLKQGKRAVELDERFDHAGPHRLVGALLVKAPGWPTSVGDVEEGAEHLQRAVELAPDYPENHLFYCEALLVNGHAADAKKECDLVLAAPAEGPWAGRLARWRAEAGQLLIKVMKRLQ